MEPKNLEDYYGWRVFVTGVSWIDLIELLDEINARYLVFWSSKGRHDLRLDPQSAMALKMRFEGEATTLKVQEVAA